MLSRGLIITQRRALIFPSNLRIIANNSKNIRFNSTKNNDIKTTNTSADSKPKITEKPIETIENPASTAVSTGTTATSIEKKEEGTATTTTSPEKPPLMSRIKHELQHYWNGTKLLGYEIKISSRLLMKMLAGYELTRRETSQLTTTVSDVLRLIPFSVFLIVPFAELLLPVALKLFPNLLPSTYESVLDKNKKTQKLMKKRKETSNFIRKTFQESGLKIPKKMNDEDKLNFVKFFQKIQDGDSKPTNLELIKVARCFKNDQVLDNLSRPQLMAMAKYMSLTPFGTDEMLRYQIRYKLLQIIKDDKAIDYEGVESLSIPELKSACASRGIKAYGASPARLRDDLKIWLDLRLRQKIPSSLLILSSTFTYGEHADDLENYYDALLAVLSSIPDELYNVAKLEITGDRNDPALKLDILKEQAELIKEEENQKKNLKSTNSIKDDLKLSDYEEKEETVESEEVNTTDTTTEEPKAEEGVAAPEQPESTESTESTQSKPDSTTTTDSTEPTKSK